MAVLIEERVERNATDTLHELMEWHGKSGRLAVSSYNPNIGGQVNFFTEHGGRSESEPIQRADVRFTQLKWHPEEHLLVVGSSDGDVMVRCVDGADEFHFPVDDAEPLSEVTSVVWNSDASVVLAADKGGVVTLNRVDTKKLRQSKRTQMITIPEGVNCAMNKKARSTLPTTRQQDVHKAVEVSTPPTAAARTPTSTSERGPADGTSPVAASPEPAGGSENAQLKPETGQPADGSSVANGSSSRPSTRATTAARSARTKSAGEEDVACFLIGGRNGGLYALAEQGVNSQQPAMVFQAEAAIVQLLEVECKSLLLVLAEDLVLYQLTMTALGGGQNAKWPEKMRVKLTGKWPNFGIIMTEEGILAMCNATKDVRIWNLNSEDNGTISLRTSKGFSAGDCVTCISYSTRKGCLSGGTSDGKVATWKRRKAREEHVNDTGGIEEEWMLQEAVDVGSQVAIIRWANTSNSLAVSTGLAVTILKEQPIVSYMGENLAAIQTGNMSLLLVRLKPSAEQQEVQLTIAVKGVFVGDKQLAVWNHEQVFIYEVHDSNNAPLKAHVVSSFTCVVSGVATFQQNVYCLEADKINVRTMQGTIKQILSMPEMEGDPQLIDVRGSRLCVATSNGFIRMYDISRREAKQQYHSKCVVESMDGFDRFVMVRLNNDGTRVSFTCTAGTTKEVHSRLNVWDAESDTLAYFDFATGMTDQQQYEAEADAALAAGQRPMTAAVRKIEKDKSRYRMVEHKPGVHCWDAEDARFLICEANHRTSDLGPNYLLSMFVTSEHGLQMQDVQPRSVRTEALFGVAVPFLYFIKKMDNDDEDTDYEKSLGRLMLRKVLREFVGLEDSDKQTREAMLNFSFYLTVGRMDEAFKAIKFIKSESVWEHMAQMCVKTRRLDVALVCLGNMGHARGARALRKAMRSGAPEEAQVATLALQLGLVEEARSLFASCGRWDLVNRLLQSQNLWNEAFEIAERHDRIHLRNTFFAYGRYLESMGEVEAAVDNYEKSDTQRFEVPRMLFDDPKVLEAYVRKRRDPNIQRWWAQYLESIGDVDGARVFYQASKDYLSVMRLLCYKKSMSEAVELANKTGDKAACYHLARYLEAEGDASQAVEFFSKAHAYSSAIRLAKEHNMKEKLANLALMVGGSELIEAARYYEELPGQADKAVMLYHKAGMVGRALDLAFRTEQFSALDLIAKDLDERSDGRVLERAAEFFVSNQQYEKAVELLAYAKNYATAIELCRKKNVPVTEKMAEILTPSKEEVANPAERTELLEQIADCCVQQRNYHFAAKKYTQAGNMLEAMRSLLKSGDTERIVFFARKARNREIYILAANFLQTLNWKSDASLMKHIETFYVKANAFEHLASFFEACAQVEIDDYRDYTKAAAALGEAQRCMGRALQQSDPKNEVHLNVKLDELTHTIASINKFIGIRTIYETDPNDAIRQLHSLADEKGIEESVRIGDIYAVMIVHNVRKSNFRKAYALIEQLRQRQPRIDVSHYVSAQLLDTICDQLQIKRITGASTIGEGLSDEGDDGGQAEGRDGVDGGDGGTVEYSHAMRRQLRRESGGSFAESALRQALDS